MPVASLKKIQAVIDRLESRSASLSRADTRRLTEAYVSLSVLRTNQGRLDLALATIEGALAVLPESTPLIDSLADIHARYAVLYKDVARRQRASQKRA